MGISAFSSGLPDTTWIPWCIVELVDQKDFDWYDMVRNLDGQGRILSFQPGVSGEWKSFFAGAFGFVDTQVNILAMEQ